ncbi:Tn3 family transposase [Dapis sp. BLCC M229]|uniref:Tn3 family transposase n=1 Tax=Dapis sp. BLCC M229 TaxID=3400188 RepID=UPI003CF56989
MSSRFLTSEQQDSYGRYVGEPTKVQLANYFYLDDTAKKLVQKRRGDYNRLGFAIQLCTVRFLGTFLTNPIDVPPGVVNYLAAQLKIEDVDCLSKYLVRFNTHWEHTLIIKKCYGYRDFNSQPAHWRLVRWLYQRAWSSGESPSMMFDLTTARLVELKILLPGVTVLSRLISTVRERVAHRTWKILSKLPNWKQIEQLEALIVVDEKAKSTPLEQLRKSPTRSSGPALVNALNRLVKIRSLGVSKLDVSQIPPIRFKALLKIVPKKWMNWVVTEDGSIDRHAYTFCVLEQILEGLRRRDLFVSVGERWSNPRAKLLQGKAWLEARASVCRTLNLNCQPEPELKVLQEQLNQAYSKTAENLPTNSEVRIEVDKKGKYSLTISNLDKLDEPESYLKLKEKVESLLPLVDLPEVLLEINAKTGFMEEFTHLNESFARVSDLEISICAILIAQGCNIGLSPLVRKGISALTRGRLSWVEQNYFRPETIIQANARLVEAQRKIPLVKSWGGGEVASADGMRFVVPVRTLNAGANSKYFKGGRGITYYNYTSNQFTGFHGVVIPGTLRDSLVVLVGLLEQQTSLRPRELMTDTSGYSDVIFGLFWLLGYQFSPRLADAGEARFWRLDSSADYGCLDKLARFTVKVELIEENWDDILRIAGSLRLGTVSAMEIMRALHRGKKPSTIAKAIGELGKITKTLYLLNYVDDEAYRRRILTQLNRGESRHSLARALFYGRRGEVRQRYREGQEEQLGTLGLVVNVLVLWNTCYMDSALNQLRSEGWVLKDDDLARLSPLLYSHINMLGRYQFNLPEELKDGAMRPLRDAEAEDELADLELW